MKKRQLESLIYNTTLVLTPMKDTLSASTAFDQAWFLIKSQPIGIAFSKAESNFINNALYDILSGNDELKKSEAKELWLQFLNHN
tara:strand:- start:984 stop:1238 length:255 start_codon:yes stop_codon:yes gene_type:complete